MAWILYIVVLLVAFVVQTTVLPLLRLDALDLMLTLALVCGLAAPTVDARLAGWITGFVKDLDTHGPLGLHALVLGLAVYVMTRLRGVVNLHAGWVRWLISFLVALPAELFVGLHRHFLQGDPRSILTIGGQALLTALVASMIAALLVGLPGMLRHRRRRTRQPVAPRW